MREPERLDRFMARANAAYYASHDPFTDFTTAPEISQVFGEILGLWAAIVWQGMGRPTPVILAEAGPGRGTLMADALRAIRSAAPDFAEALSVHLIETSPRLRELQMRAVPDAAWHNTAEDLPPGPFILLANEFLDALPIRQFVWGGGAWHERYVLDGHFIEQPAHPPPTVMAGLDPAIQRNSPGAAPHPLFPREACPGESVGRESISPIALTAAPDGTILEISEPATAFIAHLAQRITAHCGAALVTDYGPTEPTAGESLQAIRDKSPADPLRDPGSADLTTHVNFPALAETARQHGATPHGPIPQGVFLTRLGLFERTDRLARSQPPARAMALINAARRLAEPDQMGRLFKAFALCHPDSPPPPGFSAPE